MVIINYLHFRRRQLPVHENKFIQIYWAVKIVWIRVSPSQNKSAISRLSVKTGLNGWAMDQSAIFEHVKSLVSAPEVEH